MQSHEQIYQQIESKNSKKRGIEQITQDFDDLNVTHQISCEVKSLGKKMLKEEDLTRDKHMIDLSKHQ